MPKRVLPWLGAFVVTLATTGAFGQIADDSWKKLLHTATDLVQAEDALSSDKARDRLRAVETLGPYVRRFPSIGFKLISVLDDEDEQVRLACVRAVGRLNRPTVAHVLIRLTKEGKGAIRVFAADRLAVLVDAEYRDNDPRSPKYFARATGDATDPIGVDLLSMAYDRDVPADSPAIARILAVVNDADPSSAALGLLMRSPVSESLGRCLSHDDVAVRRGAARMLFEFDRDAPSADTTRDAVRYLEVALKDKDHEVRLYCLLSLAKNTEASVGIFHSFLGDEDPLIQAAALRGVERHREQQYVDGLFRLLRTGKTSRIRVRAAFVLASLAFESKARRVDVAAGIRTLADPRALGLFAVAQANYRSIWKDYYEEERHDPQIKLPPIDLKQALADLFEAVKEERSRPLPKLRTITDEPDRFESVILGAVGELGASAAPAVPWLLKELGELDSLGEGDSRGDPTGALLQNILYSLTKIGPTEELIEALNSRNRSTRATAAMALAKHPKYTQRVIPILIESLDYPCWGTCVYSHHLRADVSSLALMEERALPSLLRLIRTKRHVWAATESISMMSDEKGIVTDKLTEHIKSQEEPLRLRILLAEPLGRIGANRKKTIEFLADQARNQEADSELRVAAIEALAFSDLKSFRALLAPCLDDKNPAVRLAAQKALRRN